jgi:hypothetical protein
MHFLAATTDAVLQKAPQKKIAREGHDFSRAVKCFWVAQRFSAAKSFRSELVNIKQAACFE